MTVEGAKIRKSATVDLEVGNLPDPALPEINGTHNVVITGVGGTGVVTIGAVLAMAAHLDGKGAGMMEMAGLAQKGGAVHIHCRLANRPEDISAIRVATGECDAVIGGDLVVSAGSKTLGLMKTGRTGGVVNSHEIITGDFTRNTEFKLPIEQLELSLQARLGDRLTMFDASELAKAVMGDSIFSNMMMLGAAWQRGLVPLTHDAHLARDRVERRSCRAQQTRLRDRPLGGAEPRRGREAAGAECRRTAENPGRADRLPRRSSGRTTSPRRLAKRYRKLVDGIGDPRLKEAVAKGYHKVLAYKDEYEVARLMQQTEAKARAEFDGDIKLTYLMSPPMLSRKGPDGRPKKREFGAWIVGCFHFCRV